MTAVRTGTRAFGHALVAAALLAGAAAAETPREHRVIIEGRRVVEPAGARLVLHRGDTLVIRWLTDEAVDLHVHGYDIEVALKPGEPADTPFETRATGRFPVTSHGFGAERGHHHGPPLLYIEVHPR